MKLKGLKNTEIQILKDVRPWGHFLNFADNTMCTCKILYIKQGESLSLQYHFKRDQLYVLLDDGFKIFDTDRYEMANSGDMYFFPRGIVHRCEFVGPAMLWLLRMILKLFGINIPGVTVGRVLDVAFGENAENDIIRLEDKYGRGET